MYLFCIEKQDPYHRNYFYFSPKLKPFLHLLHVLSGKSSTLTTTTTMYMYFAHKNQSFFKVLLLSRKSQIIIKPTSCTMYITIYIGGKIRPSSHLLHVYCMQNKTYIDLLYDYEKSPLVIPNTCIF